MSKSAAAAVSIGKVWAVCDHFEGETGQPTTANMLKTVCGVDRAQLRKWVRQGRLQEFTITTAQGQRQIGYMRPKERTKEGQADNGEMEQSVH